MLSLMPPPGACLSRLLLSQRSGPVPLPSSGVPYCSMWVLLPLVLVCPSECSSVCSSFRYFSVPVYVRRPSALFPLVLSFHDVMDLSVHDHTRTEGAADTHRARSSRSHRYTPR